MKRERNQIASTGDQDDDEIRQALNELPDPGPARITTSVMMRVRRGEVKTIRVHRRDAIWGFASSLAGVFLGIWLANVIPDHPFHALNSSVYVEATNGDEESYIDLVDEIDQLVFEMSSETEVEQ